METLHCTLKYHRYKLEELNSFASRVNNGIYTNPTVFVNPPLTQSAFIQIKEGFESTYADYITYGKTKKTNFTTHKTELIEALDLMAHYVTNLAQNDASLILLAGYTPSISTQQKNATVEKVSNFNVKRGEATGEIIVNIPPITHMGSLHYFCICSEGKPLSPTAFTNGILQMNEIDNKVLFNFNKSRKKIFNSLTPAVYYYIYVFIANAISVSPLSEAKKIMAV